jgi:hypothetical protein
MNEGALRAQEIFQAQYLPRVMETGFPPKEHVCLKGMGKEENKCPELTEQTAGVLDNEILLNLFVSTQMNNLDLCIKKGLARIWEKDFVFVATADMLTMFPHFWSIQAVGHIMSQMDTDHTGFLFNSTKHTHGVSPARKWPTLAVLLT